MNPIFLIDFYKVGHVNQYPEDVTQVWSNWTPRYTHVKGATEMVHFGLQYLCLKYLMDEFHENFFDEPLDRVIYYYKKVISETLNIQNPRTDHIEWLWHYGELPIDIYSIPEGDSVPLGVPAMVITNTEDEAFWLPNYLETLISNILWKPSTSASTAQRFRRLFEKYAIASGEKDLSFVDWMGHDFSMRGMSGIEDCILSGMGHLLSFSGTDSLPAILAANQYYKANLNCGGSVPATEHSVMCAGGMNDEFGTFKRLLTKVYPEGIVSIVSDTWDLWTVLTNFIPRLKNQILKRDGKLVIRPDSGDPVKIVIGDCQDKRSGGKYGLINHPAFYGSMALLADTLGTTERKQIGALPLINNGGIIYGDGISVERAEAILDGIVNKLRLSPYNMVFGIGSFTYEYCTRDTYGLAMKATAVRRAKGVMDPGKVIDIFKSPITDSGGKVSHKGIPIVYKENGKYIVKESGKPEDLDNCAFRKVFSNGELLVYESFDTIRQRVRKQI